MKIFLSHLRSHIDECEVGECPIHECGVTFLLGVVLHPTLLDSTEILVYILVFFIHNHIETSTQEDQPHTELHGLFDLQGNNNRANR